MGYSYPSQNITPNTILIKIHLGSLNHTWCCLSIISNISLFLISHIHQIPIHIITQKVSWSENTSHHIHHQCGVRCVFSHKCLIQTLPTIKTLQSIIVHQSTQKCEYLILGVFEEDLVVWHSFYVEFQFIEVWFEEW